MRRHTFLIALLLAGNGFAVQEIKRLSPVPVPSRVPADCRVVTVFKDSPAGKAGIALGDVLQSVNGQRPPDASGFSELVSSAPENSEFKILKPTGVVQNLHIHLNAARPRLGAVCDLAGWAKPGVTAAGNESITVFSGPYAFTMSGIIDKGFVFVRIRLANDSDRPLEVDSSLFKATDGNGSMMRNLSPKDVACLMYGDKGAHLLALKKKRKDSLDTHESNLLGTDANVDEKCSETFGKGKSHHLDSEYAEANAKYLAEESLWPATDQPGQVVDGLIYFEEPSGLPVTVRVGIEGHSLSAQLGVPVASEKQMKISGLRQFFEAQKKGNSIRLTLRKGRVFVGKFSSYDTIEERAWFDTPSGGMLNTTSYSLQAIRSAEPLDQIPAKPAPDSEHLN